LDRETWLFSTPSKFENDLDNDNFPVDLRRQFEDKGIKLAQDVTVERVSLNHDSRKNKRPIWLLFEKKNPKIYFILSGEENKLKVDRPITIVVGLNLLDIPSIDEINQTFEIVAYLSARWTDEKSQLHQGNQSAYSREEARKIFDQYVDLEIVNARGPRNNIVAELFLKDDYVFEYSERFEVTLRADMDLKKFPYDTQKLGIEMGSYSHGIRDVNFILDKESIGGEIEKLTEWWINDTESKINYETYIRV
jgi:hypothetical protein